MLSLKNLYENYGLAKACLELYEHSGKNLDRMLGYFRISSNAIYPFFADDDRHVCFLRLSPVEEKTTELVASEVRFIAWLADNGFPVMEPYPMKDGRLYGVVDTEWGTYNVSCFRKVVGETLDDVDVSADIARGYGKTLGLFHNMAENYPHADERPSHLDMLAEVRGRFERHSAPALLFKELDSVSEELGKLGKDTAEYGLVHYDFEPDNVLYDEETGGYGVIDLDDSIRCWYALDVVRAIDAIDDAVEGAFIEGYRSVRQLTDAQLETLPLMRRLVALQSYSTILHVLADPPAEQPDWMVEIVEKLTGEKESIEKALI